MRKYELSIIRATVSEWNENYKDWSGTIFYKEVDIKAGIKTDELTLDDLVRAINKEFPFACLTKDELYFLNGQYASFTLIENNDGFADIDGKFLVDYDFTVKPIIEAIDLEKKFGN